MVQAGSRERLDVYDGLGVHPDQRRYIGRILELDDPADEDAVVWLDWSAARERRLGSPPSSRSRSQAQRQRRGWPAATTAR